MSEDEEDYRQIYADYLWEERGEFIEDVGCEYQNCCSFEKRDIHHILPRGLYGNNDNINHPDNLMIVCRKHHDEIEGNKHIQKKLIEKNNLDDLFNL